MDIGIRSARLGLLVLGGALLLGSGCRKPDATAAKPDSQPETAGNRPRVALVMKSLANEFFKTMEDGARAHATANPERYELLANGIKDEKDVATQIAIVEQMLAQQVAAIVIAPADSKALVPICKKAMAAGIVVINIDNRFDAAVLQEKAAVIPFVGPDNRQGAKLAGDCLAQRLQAGDEVAIIEGAPNAFNATQRKLGFEDALGTVGAKLVSSQSGQWMMGEAEKVAAGMLTQFPGLKALLCANDNMALGALAAVKAAGKAGQVLVIGYDNISAARERVRAGELLCTVDQHADQIAVFGIEHALALIGDQATTPADRETPVDLVTQATVTDQP